ncbi:hypothetical protein Q4575_12255 [Psychrosphaera sp. 1_MG-2023]|uniref:Phosphate ABC transporter substrate-binding protein n=1 Tax=Psychrosphaera algicola TaxID=3023714 RepID=A0ABT5FH73_9GAMM|nr:MULTISPECIES: hypothetical protein [unclassified Psychrosphaera]MDC2890543.1 hypothetical protein [Psychrosphaera sp. G1-22]MDO6720181.1 hypothetical protein [Psychrosphaera sp. 1_MG-2023]
MKLLLRSFKLLVMLTVFNSNALEQSLVVVVNTDNPTEQLSKRQLIDLYMGKYVAFPNGEKAQPIDGPSAMRHKFYYTLVNKNLSQINSYWSRVRFTGKATPPIGYNSMEFIQDYIANNKNAIAYIESSYVTENMKVVYRFE